MRRTLGTKGWLVALAFISSAGIAQARDAKKGQEVYTAQKCSMCHSIAGKGGKANPLDGVGAKLSADDIRHWIVNPVEATAKAKSTKKPPMPAKYGKLPPADLDALVAYMVSLK
jgi:mono/diheme cytochrome c family protein